jgi:hypothetical protein
LIVSAEEKSHMLDRKITKFACFSVFLLVSVLPVVLARHEHAEQTRKPPQQDIRNLIIKKIGENPLILDGTASGFLELTVSRGGKTQLNGWVDWGDDPQILYWRAPAKSQYISGHSFKRADIPGTGRAFTLISENAKIGGNWCLFVKIKGKFKQIHGQVPVC